MLKEIKNNIYKINYYCAGSVFIEVETKAELFEHLAKEEMKGYMITSVNLIQANGKTPKIAFRTESEYKTIINKLLKAIY